jgi:hypothetical protein
MRLKRELEVFGDEVRGQHLLIDRLQRDGASRDAEITQLGQGLAGAEVEIQSLQSELAATRELLEELLKAQDNEVQELKGRLPGADRCHLDWFPREFVQRAGEQLKRRRYSERMLEGAFILHRQSPVAYDTLRDLIASPSRPCLQTHFRELVEEQVWKMTNEAEARVVVQEHLARYPTPHMECVFAGDATGLSGSGMRQKAKGGYCFAFGVFFLDANVPDL